MTTRLHAGGSLEMTRVHGRCVCYQSGRHVRADWTLKSAAEFAARLPPITPSALLLLRKIALHPDFFTRAYNGNYLVAAYWKPTGGDLTMVTADYMELRIRGLFITRITKAGVNALA